MRAAPPAPAYAELMATARADRRPPNVDVAARQFLDLSREYLELVPTLTATAIQVDGQLPDGVRGRTIRRVAVLNMSLGRKFLTPKEAVYPPTLLHRVVDERRDRLTPEMRKNVTGAGHALAEVIKGIHEAGVRVIDGDGNATPTGDYWHRAQNGHTLHADYGKWAQHGQDAWGFTAVHGALIINPMRNLVAQTRWYLTDLGNRGVLDLGNVDTTPGDEIQADVWAPDGSPVVKPTT